MLLVLPAMLLSLGAGSIANVPLRSEKRVASNHGQREVAGTYEATRTCLAATARADRTLPLIATVRYLNHYPWLHAHPHHPWS